MKTILTALCTAGLAAGCVDQTGPEAPGAVLNGHALRDLAAAPLAEASLQESVLAAIRSGGAPLVQKLVLCALSADDTITIELDGMMLAFDGGVGLAPEWQNAPCNEACQEWVSACLGALTNTYGVPVLVRLSGTHPVWGGVDPEESTYTIEEGAFYGNVFAEPSVSFACRGRDYDAYYRNLRRCTEDGDLCGIDVVGTCGFKDAITGERRDRRACDVEDERGRYTRCYDRESDPGGGTFPEDARAYQRVLIAFLRDARFE